MFCADQFDADDMTSLTCCGAMEAQMTSATINATETQNTALGRLFSFSASARVIEWVAKLGSSLLVPREGPSGAG